MNPSTATRWIELEGAANVRDLGGLPAATGTTRPGVLLRSDALHALTGADVQRLVGGLGLRHVVDLRTPGERAERGPGLLADRVAHTELAVIEDADMDRRRAARALAVAAGDDPESIMAAGYAELLELGRWAFADVLARLLDGGTPALVHCTAGKDRTGVMVALLLDAAGVDRRAIVADYAATGERLGALTARLESSTAYRALADELPSFVLEARAGTMKRFLIHLDDRWGGAGAFFAAHGADDATLDRWRRTLVDPA